MYESYKRGKLTEKPQMNIKKYKTSTIFKFNNFPFYL